jgi:DNA-binding SARP family transcriptional activator
MRWGILGPVMVTDDAGTEIRLPAGRLRVVVVALLVRANHLVPVDELVELVWDGMPPARAARTLRVHMVRLRQALGPLAAARIVTQPPGYLCRDHGDRHAEAQILTHVGDAHHAAGELPRAWQAWRQALAIYDDFRHPEAEQVRAKLARTED